MKSTRHEVTLIIRTDKPCTKKEARYMVYQTVHGEYHCYTGESGPESFKVKTVKRYR